MDLVVSKFLIQRKGQECYLTQKATLKRDTDGEQLDQTREKIMFAVPSGIAFSYQVQYPEPEKEVCYKQLYIL